MKRIIVITGTPGVGKTTIAKKLGKLLSGASIYSTTDLVNKKKLYRGRDKFGTKLVEMAALRREIEKLIKSDTNQLIIFEGHLLCDIKISRSIAIVLREHLGTVKKRLAKRGYPIRKMRDNLVSEATDYCGEKCAQNYARSYEVMAGDKNVLNKLLAIIKGKSGPIASKVRINLLEELVPIIQSERRLAL
ncbi:MAG: AAA family ATPase [Candidatus Micrarchaeota archaeon]|nr:AAA family ATPase [Candidatus Micrarchaeota archaeon]MDE1848349.1 AAA family ATPase [Candidatus Micrarchaeota archaeon]MDE1864801.1 AAA family ATPase [Candidatus Micrarchaeota archaeon]